MIKPAVTTTAETREHNCYVSVQAGIYYNILYILYIYVFWVSSAGQAGMYIGG